MSERLRGEGRWKERIEGPSRLVAGSRYAHDLDRRGELHQHLSAYTTRGRWLRRLRRDDEAAEGAHARDHRRTNGAALGAHGSPKRSVLDVAADVHVAVGVLQRRADAEARVRSVRAGHRTKRGGAQGVE